MSGRLPDGLGIDTLAIRAGHRRTAEQEHSEPIFPTSSFVFDSAAQAAARFAGEQEGNVYSRFTNPTVAVFTERLALMERGECAIATASGMAAITTLLLGLLKAGDHIVAASSLFGTTVSLLANHLPRFGIETDFVSLTESDQWEAAIRPQTRILFLESPANPLTEVADIPALAGLAHDHGALLVVDNAFCTPALQRPLELGADVVVHSATKYLDGQGRCVGGAIVGSRELLIEGGPFGFLRTAGAAMSPFNAWVFLKGLETLGLRMRAHCEAALELARWLQQQPGVMRVYYPGLPSHPQHELAARQQSGFGGIVSFELEGGREAAWRLIDATEIFSITANLGDVKSTITHPATTTHWRMGAEARARAGIGEGLVRLSVGLEALEDLKADLARGLG